VEILSLSELVARHVRDGDTLYLTGFSHLIPFAAGHEIIRQGRRGLVLCRATPDLLYDQMIAAGTARKVVFSYAGNPGVGLLPAFRRAVERGAIEIEEWTHYEMVARLEAGASGLPFFPIRTLSNDLNRHRPTVTCPYTGETLVAVPALSPDVAIVHAHYADEEGNLYVDGLLGDIRESALAARTVVATVEAIRPATELRPLRHLLAVPGFRVAAVAEVPFGAHPSYAFGLYDRDTAFYRSWGEIARSEERLAGWLDEWVRGVPDRRAYLRKLGQAHMAALVARAAARRPRHVR
jgi:glutaconate CoA-transferase subunit A